MPGSPPPVLAEVWRGDVVESVIRGHAVVVGPDGSVEARCGDPEVVTTLRSAVKPLQAQGFLRTGACDALGAGDDELALACASHQGEEIHVATARRLLARAGRDESALACGPQWPGSAEAARALAAAGGQPGPIHNNCSGKHAAMVAACVVAGFTVEGYSHPGHPLQRCIAGVMSEHLGIDLGGAPWGIDGCGLPTYGVPLRALARGFRLAALHDPGFRRCQAAMAAHPHLVAGTGRFDTAVLAALGERLTCKVGGAAIWVAVGRDPGAPAVALKLEAGSAEAGPPVALALLEAAGLIEGELPEALAAFGAGRIHNWSGAVVGATRVHLALTRA
jgi:L-asparaginase II